MNIEKILSFWTHHNTSIIEGIFGITFLMILYLIYRQFFSQESHGESQLQSSGQSQVSINTKEIEEKLQKLIESQMKFSNSAVTSPAAEVAQAPVVVGSDSGDHSEFVKQIQNLNSSISEKDQKIQELLKQLELAKSQPSGTASGTSDTKPLQDKIKELEGRLLEYEIISEDIADLSFYKEENSRMQAELTELRQNSSATATVQSPKEKVESAELKTEIKAEINSELPKVNETPVMAAAEAAITQPSVQPESVAEETIKSTPEATQAINPETPTNVASVADKAGEDPAAAAGPIDDDILKEFAAAVAEQKKQTGESDIPEEKVKESQQLMNDFENFMKKG